MFFISYSMHNKTEARMVAYEKVHSPLKYNSKSTTLLEATSELQIYQGEKEEISQNKDYHKILLSLRKLA